MSEDISAASESTAAVDGPDAFAKAFDVSRETIHRLERYLELLHEWQSWTNLVAKSTLPDVWTRHFADSAQLTSLAPQARLWLDLGSGAGFPGLVVAILKSDEPDFQMHLIESNQRKCRFLQEVADATEAPVEIHPVRIENFRRSSLSEAPQVISARALAPLPKLLGLAEPLFGDDTRGLFLKGRDAGKEIEDAKAEWRFESETHPSLTSKESSIVDVSGLRAINRKAARR
ncbi:Ribosomal RNA small subunit methyltransferase G [Methyloligella halotolerans]|uniref:Ribosomal RNA small subunit methyltransferase G n=1 Tax=Methyloligella halotolerans TaxID=1177755 RepID=A0A1E2S0J3_9HYPH|nr:16S rRNA (guanine(527)-N(7))-methyltransferase RsmG [Methyloligella halotolerans]ODA68023.1 Ribosomal RNA small subunit methyltransferase G [Methyloligella halotolerans]